MRYDANSASLPIGGSRLRGRRTSDGAGFPRPLPKQQGPSPSLWPAYPDPANVKSNADEGSGFGDGHPVVLHRDRVRVGAAAHPGVQGVNRRQFFRA